MEDKEMQRAVSPSRDVEGQRLQVLKRSPSRASLPGSRDGDRDTHQDEGEEFEWGPSHPCFPHMNPHVPLDSPLYQSTRIIRVRRDWMIKGDLAPTYTNLYPEILDQQISEDEFRRVVDHINKELITAFDPYSTRAIVDTIISVATFWLWEDLGFVGVKQRLQKLERWIEDWNRNIGMKEGIQIISLRRTGYLSLDFQIPDPQIGIDPSLVSRPNTRMTDGSAPPREVGHENSYPINIAPPMPGIPQQHLSAGITA